ncbi:MAG: CYTH domain-containing protein [Lachnospiraceae bacterium]|nr:CYTH domain-containing protein [Lachnospiraceae bacterium]
MEIERKFLVREIPDNLNQYPQSELEQGYLARKGTTVRIRRDGDRYLLTIKKKPKDVMDAKEQDLVRIEIEEEIDEDLYRRLGAYTETPMLRKTRYRIPYGRYTIELDLYHGVLEGLATAEIEFPTVEEALGAVIPDWFGADVSSDRRYKNSNLALLTSLKTLE